MEMLRSLGEASTAVCPPSTRQLGGKTRSHLSNSRTVRAISRLPLNLGADSEIVNRFRERILQAPKTTLRLIFLNSFKMGVTAALIADALKLQS